MRKVSKTRTDDDVISSTNGSTVNDDQAASAEVSTDINEGDRDSANSVDQSIEDASDTPPKKIKGKRGRKKKVVEKNDDDQSEAEEEYEVEKIIDSKKIKGKVHFLIRWKGYSADSDTWEPENTLSCPDLINKFENEKENPKSKDKKAPKTATKKRKAAKETKAVAKRSKNDWDSKSADDNAEYEVEKILEVHHKKNGIREFLIHWKGWSTKFDSWEPESNLNCPDLIKRFMDKVSVARSSDARSLRVAPETTNRFTLQDPSSGRRLSKRRGQSQRVRYDNAE